MQKQSSCEWPRKNEQAEHKLSRFGSDSLIDTFKNRNKNGAIAACASKLNRASMDTCETWCSSTTNSSHTGGKEELIDHCGYVERVEIVDKKNAKSKWINMLKLDNTLVQKIAKRSGFKTFEESARRNSYKKRRSSVENFLNVLKGDNRFVVEDDDWISFGNEDEDKNKSFFSMFQKK